MDLSIIIVSYNSRCFLAKCINSLLGQGLGLNAEIIVVDNASQDDSVGFLRANFPQVKLISNLKNLGYAKACNQGIREAQAGFIFILNPDTEFTKGSLPEALKFMAGHPASGIIGPKLLDREGKTEFSCRAFPSYSTPFFSRHSLLTKIFPHSKYADKYLKTNWPHDSVSEVDWVSGAAMLIKRDCLQQAGLFDEGFFMYCEDMDLCRRIRDKGWVVFYYPHLEFMHIMGASIRHTSPFAIIWHHRSIWRYYKKHLKVNVFWDTLIFTATFLRAFFLSCLRLVWK